jgi:hypothetical protein
VVSVHLDIDSDPALLTAVLEGLVAANFVLMSRDPEAFPPLYESSVVYRREDRGHDEWLTADAVLHLGYADCEDLAAYRAAELRRDGIPAMGIVRPNKHGNFHAQVWLPDGTIEDPSRVLLALEARRKRGE